MIKGSKGFTLLELIVVIALFSIVTITIFGLITSSTATYSAVSDDLSLQYESQAAMSQIQEYVIDCNGAVCYNSDDATLYLLYLDKTAISETSTGCTIHAFTWKEDENEIYYATGEVLKGDSGFSYSLSEYEMSEYVTGFEAAASDSSVTVTTTFSKRRDHYTASQTIAMRNPVVSAQSIDLAIAAVCTE